MLLNTRAHLWWLIGTVIATALSSVLYVLYRNSVPDGPGGGTWQGLVFGIVGSLLMLFAGLLGMRKKVPKWRIGPAKIWLQGHIWMGLLSVPMILFHSGFRLGGLLELLLMLLLGLVTLSGIFGLAMQQYLPRLMSTEVPSAAIFNQIPVVCSRLRNRAEAVLIPICGSLFSGVGSSSPPGPADRLRHFYNDELSPFLQSRPPAECRLVNSTRSFKVFSNLQKGLPDPLLLAVAKLRDICDERRMLLLQEKLQRWLHGWLILHVPLSMALLVLGILHVVMSLYY